MKRTSMFQAAASALLFSLSCAPDDVAQDGSTSTGPDASTGFASESDAPDPPPPPADPWPGGIACQVDADCDAGNLCELRICVAGCDDAAGCDEGQVCDPHGRWQAQGENAGPPGRKTSSPQLHPCLGGTDAVISPNVEATAIAVSQLAWHFSTAILYLV